jgi:hypothetical protein
MTCSQSRRPKPWRGQPVVAASHDADVSLKALLGVHSEKPLQIAMKATASSAAEWSYAGALRGPADAAFLAQRDACALRH